MAAMQELRGALEELGKHLAPGLDIPEGGECMIDAGLGDEVLISGLGSGLRRSRS